MFKICQHSSSGVSYAYSGYLSLYWQLAILTTICCVGGIGFTWVDLENRWENVFPPQKTPFFFTLNVPCFRRKMSVLAHSKLEEEDVEGEKKIVAADSSGSSNSGFEKEEGDDDSSSSSSASESDDKDKMP